MRASKCDLGSASSGLWLQVSISWLRNPVGLSSSVHRSFVVTVLSF